MAPRRSFWERLADAVAPKPERTGGYVEALEVSSHPKGSSPRENRIAQTAGLTPPRSRAEVRRAHDYKLPLPNSQQHLFFKPETPPQYITDAQNNATFMDAASKALAPGGDKNAHQIMREEWFKISGIDMDNMYEENDWFDWDAWAEEYAEFA